MHPELLANPLFQKYYERWQEDEGSIAFAPMAEFLLRYKEFDRCIEVCLNGLKYHPELITPRLTLAKAYVQTGETDKAREELAMVLQQSPQSREALAILDSVADQIAEKTMAVPAASALSVSPEGIPLGQRLRVTRASFFQQSDSSQASVDKFVTLTMAKIYKSQGHVEKAREICELILAKEPKNSEAQQFLSQLGST
ncbi:MAG: tetratricopeptide repeat protein [Deltaproteobacteria bacterium]|nr:tetratricopeptide repeat protein [Deltaproteobacteria bacterium]